MNTPLVSVQIDSIYKVSGKLVLLPPRMALCTPDTFIAIEGIKSDLADKGGKLVLSDMFRSYDMQFQAYLDYKTGKKSAYSPPPGGSMHEAGRAFDLDLGQIKINLAEFWDVAKKYGVYPIIARADKNLKEAWHFDCRGSHQVVYEYYKNGKANNMKPYEAMSASAILALGYKHDKYPGKQREANIQFALIRLGQSLGNVDGKIGPKTRKALQNEGVPATDLNLAEQEIGYRLSLKYPGEYSPAASVADNSDRPEYIVE